MEPAIANRDIQFLFGADCGAGSARMRAAWWKRLREVAFGWQAQEIDGGGRPLFVLEQPLDALRLCLNLLDAAGDSRSLRAAVHVDALALLASPVGWRAQGGPRWLLGDGPGEFVDAMLLEPGDAMVRFSPAAAELVQRAAVGSDLPTLQWDPRLLQPADGEPPIAWLALRLAEERRAAGRRASASRDGHATIVAGRPLPGLPRWWITELGGRHGSLRGARLRHQKTGQPGAAWSASDEAGRDELRARVAAQKVLQGLGDVSLAVPIADCHLDQPPYFIVSHWLGIEPLEQCWQRAPAAIEQLLPALARLARRLDLAQAHRCAHGRLDDTAVFVARVDEMLTLQLAGLRLFDDEQACANAAYADLRALADLLFRLALGGPHCQPGPFWRGQIGSAVLGDLIGACLDPAHPRPIHRWDAFAAALERIVASDAEVEPVVADHAEPPWWRRWRR